VPSIVTLDPSHAVAGTQGLDINISATGFINTTMVYVNGTERSYTRISSTEIILSLSSADLETGGYIKIAASNPPPGGGMSNSAQFTVLNPVPVLSAISPDTVTAGSSGFTLSLTGSNFSSTTAVYFNNNPIPATFISSTQIDITIASSEITTPGTYSVKVFNPAPGGGESNTINLTVETARIPDLGIKHDEQQGGGGLVGGSIRILNGNVMESRNDLQFSSPNKMGLSFTAFYNSRSDITGALGYGWTHIYEVYLDTGCLYNGQVLFRITDNTGAARYFKETSPGLYQGVYNEHSRIIIQDEEYIWQRNDGSGYGFNLSGKLIWIEDEKSNRLEVTYGSNGLISSVKDTSSGRILTFNYNADNLLENITGPVTSAVPDGMWVQYGYDSNGNLVSVSYADGSGFNYSYTDPYDIHNLTEKKDKANHLLNTWSYDDQDRAADNFSKDGLGTTVSYISDTQVTVTDAYGTIRTYNISGEDDNKRVTALSGIAVAPYSANNAIRWEYDENMNLVEVEYAGGTINLFQNYDERGNPGTVILASGNPEQRTIHYTYHPGISVPLTRTESSVLGSGSKVTVWDYDNDYNDIPNENPAGNVSRVIEQGFTANDAGTSTPYEYITKITYNNKGRVLSIDGPLPGTGDTTSFAYDPATGDLVSTTMPHIGSTQFEDYDSIGQPGKVIDVNNHATTYIYDARGKITNTTHEADLSTQITS
jgi:YD repeat-containing protein